MYKQAILHKLDNILNNSNVNEDDKAWIEAFVSNGLDDKIELEKLQWEAANGLS